MKLERLFPKIEMSSVRDRLVNRNAILPLSITLAAVAFLLVFNQYYGFGSVDNPNRVASQEPVIPEFAVIPTEKMVSGSMENGKCSGALIGSDYANFFDWLISLGPGGHTHGYPFMIDSTLPYGDQDAELLTVGSDRYEVLEHNVSWNSCVWQVDLPLDN